MSDAVKPITVTILDKEYIVGCTENEREALFASVEFLNNKMQEQRDSGKVIGAERIAAMAALNVTHEYLEYRRHNESMSSDIDTPHILEATLPDSPVVKVFACLICDSTIRRNKRVDCSSSERITFG